MQGCARDKRVRTSSVTPKRGLRSFSLNVLADHANCYGQVVDYLREVYCIEKKWLSLPKPKGSGS